MRMHRVWKPQFAWGELGDDPATIVSPTSFSFSMRHLHRGVYYC